MIELAFDATSKTLAAGVSRLYSLPHGTRTTGSRAPSFSRPRNKSQLLSTAPATRVLPKRRGRSLDDAHRHARQDRKSTRLNSQSRQYLVCRLLLEKKKKQQRTPPQQ